MPKKSSKSSHTAIIVCGMHRSGTSLLTRLLNLKGVNLSDHILPPAKENNEKGFWEHQDVVIANDAFLQACGRTWYDLELSTEYSIDQQEQYYQELDSIIQRDFSNQKLWMVKDPRISCLLPQWSEVLQKSNIEAKLVILVRDPFEVAQSLQRRDGFTLEHGLLLWLRYYLSIASSAPLFPQNIVIGFSSLFTDWREQLAHIDQKLQVNFPVANKDIEDKILAFISPELRHQHHDDALIKTLCPELVKLVAEVNSILHKAEGKALLLSAAKKKSLTKQFTQLSEQAEASYAQSIRFRAEIDRNCQLVQETTRQQIALEQDLNIFKHQSEHMKREIYHLNTQLFEALDLNHQQLQEMNRLHHTIVSMRNSSSWKLTKPLRLLGYLIKCIKFMCKLHTLKMIWKVIFTGGIRANWWKYKELKKKFGNDTLLELVRFLSVSKRERYPEWIAKHDSLTNKDRYLIKQHIEQFNHLPKISIVMPVYNVEGRWLKMAINSVLDQLYPHWELCIADDASPKPHIKKILQQYAQKDKRIKVCYRSENGHISAASNSALELATGDYIALLDHDDMLSEHALYHVALEINNHPEVDLIYSDEDKINQNNERFSHYFKPKFHMDLFLGQNMFSHLGVYRKSIIDKIGGFRLGYEGSQDYDLCIRAIAQTSEDKIRHIPHILYHWRAIETSTAYAADTKSYANTASLKFKQEYLDIYYPGAKIMDTSYNVYHRVEWPLPDPLPSVSIIVPTRDAYELVHICIESVLAKTDYSNYEIVVMDNQSEDEQTLAYFSELEKRDNIRVISYDKPFNFSDINNVAADACDSDFLVFLNNDVEVIESGWLKEMVSHGVRDGIGIVGAKLHYPNNTVQHIGIVLGVGDAGTDRVAGHVGYTLDWKDMGYLGRTILTQEVSAVTGACLLISKSLFDEIGQFDVKNLPVAFNDVDLCLRCWESGQKVLFAPLAEFYHHESATRGKEDTTEKKMRFSKETNYMIKRWGDLLEQDPYYNPNLSLLPFMDYKPEFPPRVEKPWLTMESETTQDEQDGNQQAKHSQTDRKAA